MTSVLKYTKEHKGASIIAQMKTLQFTFACTSTVDKYNSLIKCTSKTHNTWIL